MFVTVRAAARSNHDSASLPTRRPRILAVDDDAIISEFLTFLLGETYDIRTATTGDEALLSVRRDPVDLVMLDHRLTDCTGLEVLIELRSFHPLLPVVMLTGYGSECAPRPSGLA